LVKSIPEGYHTVTPALIVNDGQKALDFYKKAFDAKERFKMNMPDERLGHAELQIGDSVIMVSDGFPEMKC
jgi:PhnB protein